MITAAGTGGLRVSGPEAKTRSEQVRSLQQGTIPASPSKS